MYKMTDVILYFDNNYPIYYRRQREAFFFGLFGRECALSLHRCYDDGDNKMTTSQNFGCRLSAGEVRT